MLTERSTKSLLESRKEKLIAQWKEQNKLLQSFYEKEPFYGYRPSDGTVTPEMRKLFEEFLKPEDIPDE